VQSVVAAAPGFDVPDTYAVALVFVGLAVAAAVGALSHQHDRAFSASLIYLALGVGAAVVIQLFDLRWLDPVDDAVLVRRLAEFAVVVALFSTGLKLDRELSWHGWSSVARLLGVAMPVTIAAVAAFGALAMGLSLGAAIVLGAVLAPTDPVLAGDIGVGPPGEEDEREPNVAITAEAGLNDGLAYPFVLLGLLLAARGENGWFGEWVVADLLWPIAGGVAIGAGMGYGCAALAVRLRDRRLLASDYDGWLALAAVLVIYGVTEVATAYGFLAAFAGGLAFRRYEREHELNARVHTGAEVTEKFSELAVMLLLGSVVTLSGISRPGWSGWLLVPVLLLVIRPAAVLVSLLGSRLRREERFFLAWFGVRGIGSLYYATAAVAIGGLALESEVTIVWTAWVCVLCSVVVHGVTGAPFTRRFIELAEQSPGVERR
jgi:sodium/hydrogen antiporter